MGLSLKTGLSAPTRKGVGNSTKALSLVDSKSGVLIITFVGRRLPRQSEHFQVKLPPEETNMSYLLLVTPAEKGYISAILSKIN